MIKVYQCKYCGRKIQSPYGVPLKTRCVRRKPTGLHVWVRIK